MGTTPQISSIKDETSNKTRMVDSYNLDGCRSIKIFYSAIKSPFTKLAYTCALREFLEWTKIPNPDELLKQTDSGLQGKLEDYFMHLQGKLHPNTIPVKVAGLDLFFSMNDKSLNFKKIRKLLPEKVKKTGYGLWTTDDIKKMFTVVSSLRAISVILFVASTGVRIGAIPELKVKHIKEMPRGCKLVKIYENSKEEYVSFLTPEASKALDMYLHKRHTDGENVTLESPLFRNRYAESKSGIKPISIPGLKEMMDGIVVKSGLERKKTGRRYEIQRWHGFRKRYNTILKSNKEINSNISEKLMGHKNGLDGVYFVPSEEQLFAEFCKAIQDLTINDSERDKVKITKLEEELSEKQKLEDEVQRQKQAIAYLLSKDPESNKVLDLRSKSIWN